MTKTKVQLMTDESKKEMFWTIINALLLGGAVFFGAFLDGNLNKTEILASFGAASILFLKTISDYWMNEKKEYSKKAQVGFAKFI